MFSSRMTSRTARATGVLLLAGTGIVFTSAGPASAHGACRPPSDIQRVSGLKASGKVSCATARRVASAYDAHVMGTESFPGGQPVSVLGYTCRTSQVGHSSEETFSVRCSSGRGVVRFAWGV